MSPSRLLKAGLAYFALVFGTGFVLGVVRVLLLVPQLGVRRAELLELPLMLLASYVAARFCLRHFGPFSRPRRLALGLLALLCLVAAEVGLGVAMGRSPVDYLDGRDPVSGPAYFLALLVFGLLPVLVRNDPPLPPPSSPPDASGRKGNVPGGSLPSGQPLPPARNHKPCRKPPRRATRAGHSAGNRPPRAAPGKFPGLS